MKHLKVSKKEAKNNIINVLMKIDYEDLSLKKLGLYDYLDMRSFGMGKKVASSNTVVVQEALGIDLIDCFTMAEIFEEIFQNKEVLNKIQRMKEGA